MFKPYSINKDYFTNLIQVWKDCEPGQLIFLIAKLPETRCSLTHCSAYGVIRNKLIVEPDRWNDFKMQKFLSFSGMVVFPPDKRGHANLMVDMNDVLHIMPSLPRVLAQVERALKFYEGISKS